MHTKFLNMTLAAIAVCSAGLLGSCQKDELYGQEEFLSHVPENVALEEFSETSFTISWDYVNGATSYTVQLVDMDEVPTEATVYTTTNESAHAFSFSQDDIDKGTVNTVWYARVRANFPRNNYSNWVYVTYDDSDERAVLITGLGKVRIIPELSVLKTTSSSLTYEWSFTEDAASDAANSYELCLYSDEACENLVVGWTINGDDGIFSTGAGDLTRFTFSGLDAATTYYAKVRNTSLGGIVSSAVAGTTSEAGPAVTATEAGSAKAGDVIVSEEFAKVYHGGDVANCAAAYYIASDYRSENIKASGMDAENCNVTKFTANEFDVFDGGGVTAEYTQGTGLSEWAHVANAAGRSGYIKLGAGSANASLWTPELKALPAGSSTVKVSFSAKNYSERVDGSSADPGKLIVSAVAGAEISDKRVASGGTVIAQSAEIDITAAATEFQTFEVTLQNVTPDSRISIGTVEKRALIDNIVVTYVGPAEITKLSVPANVAFDSEAVFADQLTLKWDAVEGAVSYTVKYWADGQEASSTEVAEIGENTYNITGLTANTTYYASVKACSFFGTEYDSDYSTAVSTATTEEEVPGIVLKVVARTTSTIVVEWDQFEDETKYTLEIEEQGNPANKNTFTYDWDVPITNKGVGNGYGDGLPFRFVFNYAGDTWPDAYLSADKTYLIRIKAGGADSENQFSDDITGTVLQYNAPAGEIFHENFDRFMGSDAVNLATGVKGSQKVSDETGLSNMLTDIAYVAWYTGGGAMHAGSGSYADDIRFRFFMSEGWSIGDFKGGNGTHNAFCGCFRLGGDNTDQGYIATPAMSSLTGATDVTVNFKTAANVFWQTGTPGNPAVSFNGKWRRDAFEVCDVYVEHADGTRTQVADNLAVGVEGAEFKWKSQSVNIDGLLPTDKIVFATTDTKKSRYYIDEISVVKR